MKKLKKLMFVAVALVVPFLFAMSSFAGPSRALIQEMGSVIGGEEVNVDVDWVGQGLDVTAAGDAAVGAGNATIGGIVLSSVNVGLTDKLELRIGRLPGLRSYVTLPVADSDGDGVGDLPISSPNNYGLTLKAAGFVPGLGVWLGYGSQAFERVDIASNDTAKGFEGSSLRLGAAYTWAGPVILNGTVAYGSDASKTAGVKGPDTTTIELAAAALYPLRSSLLVGVELHYATISNADTAVGDVDLTVFVPAIGARAVAGNWTIDAVVALLGGSVGVDVGDIDLNKTATATVIGVPNVRVNYKF